MLPNYSKRFFLRQEERDNKQEDTQQHNSGSLKTNRQVAIDLADQTKSNPRPAVRKAEKQQCASQNSQKAWNWQHR